MRAAGYPLQIVSNILANYLIISSSRAGPFETMDTRTPISFSILSM